MSFNPSKLKYSFKEFIGIYENSFTKEECNSVINLFEKSDKLGYTYSRLNYGENLNKINDTAARLSPVTELDWDPEFISMFHERFYNYIYSLYNLQYATLQKLSQHRSRYIKIQRTRPTEGYHVWHCEHNAIPHMRDRVLSWILYLNDVEEGGETEFLYQSLRFKPKAGTFLLFPAQFTHTHRGNPPLSGVKYIATGWIEYSYTAEPQGSSHFPDLNEDTQNKNISYQ